MKTRGVLAAWPDALGDRRVLKTPKGKVPSMQANSTHAIVHLLTPPAPCGIRSISARRLTLMWAGLP